MKKNKNNKKAIAILIIAIAVIIIILSIVLAVIKNKNKQVDQAILDKEAAQIYNDTMINQLANMTEMQRMKTYAANFIEHVEKKDYNAVYEVLYSEFKENYFRTLTEFENYCKDYFPVIFNVEYNNIERLDNIYVLETTITDLVDMDRTFGMYIVIRENALNDYDISFSVNSAKDA